MTDPNFTLIVVILDRSSSMQGCLQGTRAGFNTFLAEQQKLPGTAWLHLVTFNEYVTVMAPYVPIGGVEPLTKETYCPHGNTALLDAQGQTIDAVGKRLAGMPESSRPSKVVVVTITDGYENASRSYTNEQIRKRIKEQTEVYGWQFMYLGANQDAVTEGAKMGYASTHSATYHSTDQGTQSAFSAANAGVSCLRSAGGVSAEISANERTKLEESK